MIVHHIPLVADEFLIQKTCTYAARWSIFLMIYKIPSPPRNLVVPSHFLPQTGKFGPIRQKKYPQNKVFRARRDRRATRDPS